VDVCRPNEEVLEETDVDWVIGVDDAAPAPAAATAADDDDDANDADDDNDDVIDDVVDDEAADDIALLLAPTPDVRLPNAASSNANRSAAGLMCSRNRCLGTLNPTRCDWWNGLVTN
jgi:hypothetical protein